METKPSARLTYFFFLFIFLVRILPVAFFALQANKGIVSGHFDQSIYVMGAETILKTGVNPFNFFSPVNFLFTAFFLLVSHGNVFVPMAAMAVVGWLMVVGVYALGKSLHGEKTALVAACIAGLYPDFIFMGVLLYPETLAAFFIIMSFFFLVKNLQSSKNYYLIFSGILWGVASQTRGGLHYFALLIPVVLLARHFKKKHMAWKPAATFLLSAYVTIYAIGIGTSPVQGGSGLNSGSGVGSIVHGANRLINCCPDYGYVRGNLFYDINACREQWPEGSLFLAGNYLEVPMQAVLVKLCGFIFEDPIIYFKHSMEKISYLWSPNQMLIGDLKLKLYYKYPFLTDGLCLLISLIYVAVLCGGLLGLLASRDMFRPFFIFFILFYCGLIFFTVGNAKLRFPMMPFFIMYCAYFIWGIFKKTISLKTALCNKWAILFLVIIMCNSVYRYREILLSPAEIQVQKIELCNELGFPQTALYLYDRHNGYGHYTEGQKARLNQEQGKALHTMKNAGH